MVQITTPKIWWYAILWYYVKKDLFTTELNNAGFWPLVSKWFKPQSPKSIPGFLMWYILIKIYTYTHVIVWTWYVYGQQPWQQWQHDTIIRLQFFCGCIKIKKKRYGIVLLNIFVLFTQLHQSKTLIQLELWIQLQLYLDECLKK